MRRTAVLIFALAIACSGERSADDGGGAPSAGAAPAASEPTAEPAGGSAPAAATETTASGLKITHLRPGTGPHPTATDTVKVHYHGTFPDGKVFDSSVDRGKPASFPLNRVIRCWTEGVQLIGVGGKAKLECPPAIAYGARGAPPRIPPNATLFFEVELIEIE